MIGVVGVNHSSAPVELRELFVFSEEEIERFAGSLPEAGPFPELVVLSTCNRTELYFNSSRPCERRDVNALIRALTGFKGIEAEVKPYFYSYIEDRAVVHLFRVAAGLNSMVLGENQILGQVKEAYRISASRKLTGTVLNRLFHRAFEVGKVVRTTTAINEGASSVSYAAVELASKIFASLEEHPVLLIGAGQTGELVLQSLAHRGSSHLHVTNRTASRASDLAERYGAEALPFDRLGEHLQHADIVITSTASRTPLVDAGLMRKVMQERHGRPIFLIDLSVPRDVDETVRAIEGVFAYDIDDLQMVVAHNSERRKQEIAKAEQAIQSYTRDFFAWLATLELSPTIARLKEKLQGVARGELEGLKSRMSEDSYRRVQEFAEFLQGKYLGLIVKNLKSLSRDGQQLETIELVNQLFELRGGEG